MELIRVENERLRQRVAELEAELADAKKAGGGPGQSRLMDLLREKNKQLEADQQELHKRAAEVQESADELAAKNEQLVNSMAALRLYQLMFENDPNGLIGVSPEGMIVQFNSSAIRFFGYDLHKLRLQDVSGLALPGTDLDLKAIFETALEKGESEPVECQQEDRRGRLTCYRLEDIRGRRGVVFRVSELKGE